MFAAKSVAIRVHHLFCDLATSEIDIQIDLRGYIASTNNRADKCNHSVAINILKTDAVLKLGVRHHASTVLGRTRQQIAVLVNNSDIVLRHEWH